MTDDAWAIPTDLNRLRKRVLRAALLWAVVAVTAASGFTCVRLNNHYRDTHTRAQQRLEILRDNIGAHFHTVAGLAQALAAQSASVSLDTARGVLPPADLERMSSQAEQLINKMIVRRVSGRYLALVRKQIDVLFELTKTSDEVDSRYNENVLQLKVSLRQGKLPG